MNTNQNRNSKWGGAYEGCRHTDGTPTNVYNIFYGMGQHGIMCYATFDIMGYDLWLHCCIASCAIGRIWFINAFSHAKYKHGSCPA
jgi:hypothetical protein